MDRDMLSISVFRLKKKGGNEQYEKSMCLPHAATDVHRCCGVFYYDESAK